MAELTRVVCISLLPAPPDFVNYYGVEATDPYNPEVGEWGFMAEADALTEETAGTVLLHRKATMADIEAAIDPERYESLPGRMVPL